MAQNEKEFCPSHSLSQEPYIMWLWFLVHMSKMMIFLVIFFDRSPRKWLLMLFFILIGVCEKGGNPFQGEGIVCFVRQFLGICFVSFVVFFFSNSECLI